MSQELALQLCALIGACAGVYAAIRAELVRAIVTAEQAAKDSASAHERLDVHIDKHHTK